MLENLMHKIENINPWHFLWIGICFSEIFTFIMNFVMSYLWWGHLSIDLLLIGAVAKLLPKLIIGIIDSSSIASNVNPVLYDNVFNVIPCAMVLISVNIFFESEDFTEE